MRKLISAMKMSLDGMIAGPDGQDADWVTGWSDDYGLTPRIDACVLGGGMYPDYEEYWTAIHDAPDQVTPLNRLATQGEVAWARFAAHTPHYVVSRTLTSARWPNTSFLRSTEEVAALKKQSGKDIYLVGGAELVASMIDAGLVDELRLLVYPLVAGAGKPLFATSEKRSAFVLQEARPLTDGRASLAYIRA